jgi:hypothetical protein
MLKKDELFKQLLCLYFIEFVEVFFKELRKIIDTDSLEYYINYHLYSYNVDKYKVGDLAIKTKLKGDKSFIILSFEHRESIPQNFPSKVFMDFGGLWDVDGYVIYPIIIFCNNQLRMPQPNEYKQQTFDINFLSYKYPTLQLGLLDWKDFLHLENPIICAFMATMKMEEEERPIVKSKCLEMLDKLQLESDKEKIILDFIEAHLI